MRRTSGWSEDLGSKLRALRLAHKVKQIDLARSLGISPAYLNLIENNKRPMHVDILEKLLDFFGIDMDVFMSATEGVKLQSRFEGLLKDPYLQAHTLNEEDLKTLRENSAVSNLVLALYSGFKSSRQEVNRLQQRLFSDEQNRASDGEVPDSTYILDPTAYDEVTEFLEHHSNYFPSIEQMAEEMLSAEGSEDGRRTQVLASILQKRFKIEAVPRRFPPGSHLLRLYNEKDRRLYVSKSFGTHRLHFQLAHFIGLMSFEKEPIVEDLISGFPLRRDEASALVKVNLANYFAGAMLLPYRQFLSVVEETAYDIEAMEGAFSMPFEAIAHRLCTLSKPGESGIPLHFIRSDLAGNISKKYSGTGLKIDDRRRTCPKWAVHTAFLTPSILRRQYSIMPGGEQYLCAAMATVQHDAQTLAVSNANSVGIGCRAEDAHHMAYSRGLKIENPDRDAVQIGQTCRLCDRADCAQRALPSFKMEYEINTINRKQNVLSPIQPEDLLLIAEGGKAEGN